MNGSEERTVRGIVCYRNADGSFSDDVDELYLDEELTEYEEKKLDYFVAKVLAPKFAEYVRSLSERVN